MVRYLTIENLLSSFIYNKHFADNNFCSNDRRCGGNVELVLFNSCLVLGLCLLECNLDFNNVLGIYYVKIQFSLIINRKVIL